MVRLLLKKRNPFSDNYTFSVASLSYCQITYDVDTRTYILCVSVPGIFIEILSIFSKSNKMAPTFFLLHTYPSQYASIQSYFLSRTHSICYSHKIQSI